MHVQTHVRGPREGEGFRARFYPTSRPKSAGGRRRSAERLVTVRRVTRNVKGTLGNGSEATLRAASETYTASTNNVYRRAACKPFQPLSRSRSCGIKNSLPSGRRALSRCHATIASIEPETQRGQRNPKLLRGELFIRAGGGGRY